MQHLGAFPDRCDKRDGFWSVARAEYNWNVWPQGTDVFVGLRPVHLRHHHVQQDQINAVDIEFEQIDGFAAIDGGKDVVPEFAEHLVSGLPKAVMVIGQEEARSVNAVLARVDLPRGGALGDADHFGPPSRAVDAEARAPESEPAWVRTIISD